MYQCCNNIVLEYFKSTFNKFTRIVYTAAKSMRGKNQNKSKISMTKASLLLLESNKAHQSEVKQGK